MTDLRHHDVVNCYRLVLGRDPESDAVVEEKLAQPKVGLVKDFFSSPEFSEGVLRAIAEDRAVLNSHRAFPTEEIKAPAADFLLLTPGTVERLPAAKTWKVRLCDARGTGSRWSCESCRRRSASRCSIRLQTPPRSSGCTRLAPTI